MVRRRQTKQKETIYSILSHTTSHPTAQAVYEQTKKSIPDISLGTVYRNLNLMADDGLIRRIDVGDNNVHFDADLSFHHHLKCQLCGKVMDIKIDDDHLKALDSTIESQYGIKIISSEVIFQGLCDQCNNN